MLPIWLCRLQRSLWSCSWSLVGLRCTVCNGPQYAALGDASRDRKGNGCMIFYPCMKGAGAEVGSHKVIIERKYVFDFV